MFTVALLQPFPIRSDAFCVVTGTSGPVAARLAIARAQRQLSEEAGVHLHIRNFAIINQVRFTTQFSCDYASSTVSYSHAHLCQPKACMVLLQRNARVASMCTLLNSG